MSGISQLDHQFTINGVLSTNNTVLENMEKLARSCGCWISYDIHAGLWSVIINRAGDSIRSFNDSNIVGPVNVSSTGLTDIYNSVKVSYPRSDINDQIDWVKFDLPSSERYYNEPDNTLEITCELLNDPVQATVIGAIEMNQARIDKVATFTTDYSAIDLNSGDIIDITNSALGWTNKEFRVITMREVDDDAGAIRIEITALEYDDSIYNPDVTRYERSDQNGIITVGDIGTPATPTITRFEQDPRPRLILEATTPSGIVEGMEFWLSSTSSSSGYALVGTTYPVGGGSYGASVGVELDVDWANAGNVWVKVRGVNSTTTGPFSNYVADTYTPQQTTQAIATTTQVTDSSGGNILTTLGAGGLLALLNGLLVGNNTSSGSMFDKIFDLYNDVTGVNILDPGNSITGFNQVASDSTVLTIGAGQTLQLVSGTGVTLTPNTLTKSITIDSTGGTSGNLLVGPSGSTVIPLSANVQFVGNSAYSGSTARDTLIRISGNTATTPDRVTFAATPGNATMMWNQGSHVVDSSGPYPGGYTLTGGNVAAATSGYVFLNAVFNWTATSSLQDDKRVQMNLLVNGTSVASTSDSSIYVDAYENQVLNLFYTTPITAGANLRVDFAIQSDVADGIEIDYMLFQTYTTTAT